MLFYEFLKLFHILAAFMFISFGVASLLTQSSKLVKAMFGACSLLALIGGVGLIGVLKQGMPGWMTAKLIIWAVIMALVGVVNKRFPSYRTHAIGGLFFLVGLAIFYAVYKP